MSSVLDLLKEVLYDALFPRVSNRQAGSFVNPPFEKSGSIPQMLLDLLSCHQLALLRTLCSVL